MSPRSAAASIPKLGQSARPAAQRHAPSLHGELAKPHRFPLCRHQLKGMRIVAGTRFLIS
jgi:hypothetical protein